MTTARWQNAPKLPGLALRLLSSLRFRWLTGLSQPNSSAPSGEGKPAGSSPPADGPMLMICYLYLTRYLRDVTLLTVLNPSPSPAPVHLVKA